MSKCHVCGSDIMKYTVKNDTPNKGESIISVRVNPVNATERRLNGLMRRNSPPQVLQL